MPKEFMKIALALVATGVSSLCLAKGPTVMISVAGPGLALPVHSTGEVATSPSVWGAEFALVDLGAVSEPSEDLARYLVYFWVDLGEQDEMKYTVQFVVDSTSNQAFVYVPGNGDRWYANNSFTIWRPETDGKWFIANPEWAQALRRIIDGDAGAA